MNEKSWRNLRITILVVVTGTLIHFTGTRIGKEMRSGLLDEITKNEKLYKAGPLKPEADWGPRWERVEHGDGPTELKWRGYGPGGKAMTFSYGIEPTERAPVDVRYFQHPLVDVLFSHQSCTRWSKYLALGHDGRLMEAWCTVPGPMIILQDDGGFDLAKIAERPKCDEGAIFPALAYDGKFYEAVCRDNVLIVADEIKVPAGKPVKEKEKAALPIPSKDFHPLLWSGVDRVNHYSIHGVFAKDRAQLLTQCLFTEAERNKRNEKSYYAFEIRLEVKGSTREPSGMFPTPVYTANYRQCEDLPEHSVACSDKTNDCWLIYYEDDFRQGPDGR